jgi:hypothetical protein
MPREESGSQLVEMTHAGKSIAIRDHENQFELRIDGIRIPMARRMAPHQYMTDLLPYRDFPTAKEMAMALAETEGTIWVLNRKKGAASKMTHRK